MQPTSFVVPAEIAADCLKLQLRIALQLLAAASPAPGNPKNAQRSGLTEIAREVYKCSIDGLECLGPLPKVQRKQALDTMRQFRVRLADVDSTPGARSRTTV